MKKCTWLTTILFLTALLFSGMAAAQESGDIVGDSLSGPGSISFETKGDIMFSFGNRARIIPTSESDYDFGISEDFNVDLAKQRQTTPGGDELYDLSLLNALGTGFFKTHVNETGWVTEDYIRIENQIYFNAMAKDRKWAFHGALEFDRPVDTVVVDDRGGYSDDTSDFGMERLRGTYQFNDNLNFNAGFDLWFVPDPAGLTYGDDAPGFWINGDYDAFDFSVAYIKASENNWGTGPADDNLDTAKDEDRDIYAGYLTYDLLEGQKLTGLYMFDRIRNVPTGTLQQRLYQGFADNAEDVDDLLFSDDNSNFAFLEDVTGSAPETDVHYLGAIYEGQMGVLNYFLEGVYRFGEVEDVNAEGTNLLMNPHMTRDDYDISAYAVSGDLELDLSDSVGLGFKPHLGFIYTSGDDDPDDGDLEGYDGALSFQRFTKFGGENTITGDTNIMMGTAVYSFLPGLYGNGTPIVAGGLSNGTALGTSRADNPGLTMSSIGFTLTPKRFLIFKTNVNSFWWNEDISVASFAAPPALPEGTNPAFPTQEVGVQNTRVESDYVGTEWDAELTLAMSKNTFVKLQGAVLFPGEMLEEVSAARTATLDLASWDPTSGEDIPVTPGEESDEMAYRLALEFIWSF